MELLHQIKAARRVSTPVIAINTPDPAATMQQVTEAIVNGKGPEKAPPVMTWDVVRGLVGVNDKGVTMVQDLMGDAQASTMGPSGLVETLDAAAKQPPENCILYVANAHRNIDDPSIAQAIWNVRDVFKGIKATLILLSPSIRLPAELQQDVLVLDEPLPTGGQLKGILAQLYEDARVVPGVEIVPSIDALLGLAAFPAEQAAAMSLTRDGMDVDALWERKRQMIEQTPGLAVWRGGERFEDIGGVENILHFLHQVLSGAAAPKAIVFIDEIEKALGGASGAGGDTSGVSQDYLGQLLTYMQDQEATGMLFVGPPGSAKSMVAKAAGNEAAIPTIQLDLGGMKGSLVGQSEQALRGALKVVSAVTNDAPLFIATCNKLADLPPELRRRFNFGTFYFDLPTDDERKDIWALYTQLPKYAATDIEVMPLPIDKGWTGAEIRQCVDLAWRLTCSLKDASKYIVPVSMSASEIITRLQDQANGRFISASYPGTYQKGKEAPPRQTRRVVDLEEDA